MIRKHEDAGIKHLNDRKALKNNRLCLWKMDHYNPTRKRKLLTVFDDTIVANLKNKKIQVIIKELFIRCRKLNISLVFISQSYFSVPKILQIKFITFFDDENCNRRELKNIPIYRSADIDYNDFMKI